MNDQKNDTELVMDLVKERIWSQFLETEEQIDAMQTYLIFTMIMA